MRQKINRFGNKTSFFLVFYNMFKKYSIPAQPVKLLKTNVIIIFIFFQKPRTIPIIIVLLKNNNNFLLFLTYAQF